MGIMNISRIFKVLRIGSNFYSRYNLKNYGHSAVVTAASSKIIEVINEILSGCLHKLVKSQIFKSHIPHIRYSS